MELDSKLFQLASDDRKETTLDRCKIIDISFHCTEPEWKLHCVTFRNFYSYSVSVFYKRSAECEWTTCCEERRLMPHSGSERGSQDVIVLNREHCLAEKPSSLRIVLKQPSENWKDFGLCDLKCVGTTTTNPTANGKHADGAHRPAVNAIQRMLSTSDYMENYNIPYLSSV